MKLAILTFTLQTNFGGILQAYALQTVLERMGHEVVHLQEKKKILPLHPIWKMPLVYIKRIIRKYLGEEKSLPVFMDPRKWIRMNTDAFIDSYIHSRYLKNEDWNEQNMSIYDAIIFGSDQIWRPLYAWPLERFFGNFIETSSIKRIAYATSFGTDENEFTDEQLQRCSSLLSHFKAVSVREYSAVEICSKNFGVEATHVLDPTLLLSVENYIELIKNKKVSASKGSLGVYVLDENKEVNDFVKRLAIEKNLKPFSMGSKIEDGNASIMERQQPPVEQWLRAFYDAEFIVTDSFHGTVFSILFHKSFICVGNRNRGMSRFNSLLSLFDLEERLVDISHLKDLKFANINWEAVDEILFRERKKAISFLEMALNL